MKISNNINYNINQTQIQQTKLRSFKGSTVVLDSFENEQLNGNVKEPSFLKSVFTVLISILKTIKEIFTDTTKKAEQVQSPNDNKDEDVELSDFAKEIKQGLEIKADRTYPNSSFKSIMSPEELKEILPTLTSQNFRRNDKNVRQGIYCADLDYQTNFSNGKKNICKILDEVAQYADDFIEQQKIVQKASEELGIEKQEIRPFVFALTDRDCIESVQHAIRIIAEDPEKFKNVKFVPGVKLTFAHRADASEQQYENSELLVYGINPFSKNIESFIDNIIQKRKDMILNFIREINKNYPEFGYNILEFAEQNKLQYNKSYQESNLYWRVREYAETKGGAVLKGHPLSNEAINKEVDKIFENLRQIQNGSGRNRDKLTSIIGEGEEYFNETIGTIFRKYSTHVDKDSGEIVSSAENLFEDIIDCLSKEKEKPAIAIAAPIYLSHYFGEKKSVEFPKVVEFLDELKEKSNGMLLAFESIVPSYGLDNVLSKNSIKAFNNYMRKNTDLYLVGGSFEGEKPN